MFREGAGAGKSFIRQNGSLFFPRRADRISDFMRGYRVFPGLFHVKHFCRMFRGSIFGERIPEEITGNRGKRFLLSKVKKFVSFESGQGFFRKMTDRHAKTPLCAGFFCPYSFSPISFPAVCSGYRLLPSGKFPAWACGGGGRGASVSRHPCRIFGKSFPSDDG